MAIKNRHIYFLAVPVLGGLFLAGNIMNSNT